jgi:hypothetical protein
LWHVRPNFRCWGMKDATEINRSAPSTFEQNMKIATDRGTYYVWCQQVTRCLRTSRRHVAILQPLTDVSNSNRCWTPLTLTLCFVFCVFRRNSLVQPCLWILHQKLILACLMFKIRPPSTSSSPLFNWYDKSHCFWVMKVYSEGPTLPLNRYEKCIIYLTLLLFCCIVLIRM